MVTVLCPLLGYFTVQRYQGTFPVHRWDGILFLYTDMVVFLNIHGYVFLYTDTKVLFLCRYTGVLFLWTDDEHFPCVHIPGYFFLHRYRYKVLPCAQRPQYFSCVHIPGHFSLHRYQGTFSCTQTPKYFPVHRDHSTFPVYIYRVWGYFSCTQILGYFSRTQILGYFSCAQIPEHFSCAQILEYFSCTQIPEHLSCEQISRYFSNAHIPGYLPWVQLHKYFFYVQMPGYLSCVQKCTLLSLNSQKRSWSVQRVNMLDRNNLELEKNNWQSRRSGAWASKHLPRNDHQDETSSTASIFFNYPRTKPRVQLLHSSQCNPF